MKLIDEPRQRFTKVVVRKGIEATRIRLGNGWFRNRSPHTHQLGVTSI